MAFKLAEAYVQFSRRGFGRVIGGLGMIRSRLASIVNPAAIAGSAIAAIGGGASLAGMLKLSAQMESLSISFEVLLGSAEKARDMMAEINEFAAKTPYEQMQVANAAKQLLAFGVAQEHVIGTMRQLGDIASLSGARLEDLIRIFGKAKGTGVVMTETLDMFLERGIPVGRELAKIFGVAETEIRKLAPTGKITFAILQQALANLTGEGGQFEGGMKRLSKTTGGLWSTFVGNFKQVMAKIGDEVIKVFDLKAAISKLASGVDAFWARYKQPIINVLKTIDLAFKMLNVATRTFWSLMGEGFNAIKNTGFGKWLGGLGDSFMDFVDKTRTTLGFLIDQWQLAWELMKSIVKDKVADMTESMLAFLQMREARLQGESTRTHILKMFFEAARKNYGKGGAPEAASGGGVPGAPGLGAGGGRPGGFAVTGLAALADQMQSEAGKRNAERTAMATEKTADGVAQLNQKFERGMGNQMGQFMPATG